MRLSMRQVVIALAVVAGCALVGFGTTQLFGYRTPLAPDLAVEQRLMCPQCQGVRLDVCDRPLCDDMRADIRHRLAAGEGEDAIVSGYGAAYGPAVLAAAGGSERSALVPWLFVLVGLVLLGSLALGRQPSAEPVPAAALPPPDASSKPVAGQLVENELAAWRRGR